MTHHALLTGFTTASTASAVIAGVDLHGKRIIVTGGGSGIGIETARVLACAGAEVTIAVRDVQAGARAAALNQPVRGAGSIKVAPLDLLDRTSIARFARDWQGRLDVLVNNAGIMALPQIQRTAEGWELQFATNHLGHFALTMGLHRALASASGARIVSVSSNAHRISPIVFEDIMFERRPYDEWSAYGQSKTANVLLAVEAGRRWADDGIIANALMPGGIRTPLQRHQTSPEMLELLANYPWKTLEQGASTSVLLAASPLIEGVTGRYFEDNNQAPLTDVADSETGVHVHALDPQAAEALWERSLQLIKNTAPL